MNLENEDETADTEIVHPMEFKIWTITAFGGVGLEWDRMDERDEIVIVGFLRVCTLRYPCRFPQARTV